MDIDISQYNIHIEDSFAVSKKEMSDILNVVLQYAMEQGCEVCKRSRLSLMLEWIAHNLLYRLHIQRARTKDVDLNFPQSWKERLFYPIMGVVGYLFIR